MAFYADYLGIESLGQACGREISKLSKMIWVSLIIPMRDMSLSPPKKQSMMMKLCLVDLMILPEILDDNLPVVDSIRMTEYVVCHLSMLLDHK
jgi:hypothetical protein